MASASLALDAVKSGHVDLWYSDPANALKQAIPVEYDTRFVQAFQSLSLGTQQVLTLPPGAGIKDCVLVMGFSADQLDATLNDGAPNWVLPKGWGYLAIDRIAWRVAGSSEYYLTGTQLALRNARMVRTNPQADNLINLGGSQVSVAADYTTDQFAYIPLTMWKAPGLDSFEPALASDLLGSQIQVRVYLKNATDFWSAIAPGTGSPPASFSKAYFQVEQLNMLNRAQSLAAHEDLSTHTYVAPLRAFDQQVLTAQIPTGWQPGNQVTITGIMSGQVRAVQCWLIDNNDLAANSPNKLITQAPTSVRVAYAGVVYAQYDDGVSQIFNLLDSSKTSAINSTRISLAGGAVASTSVLAKYAMCPFAQPIESDEEAQLLVAGKPISNGAITFFLTVPPDSGAGFTFYVVPVLNGAIAYSRGSAQVLVG